MVTMLRLDRSLTLLLTFQFLFLAVLLVTGCGSKEKKQSPGTGTAGREGAAENPVPEEMKFDVDPALLGLSYADSSLGLRFSPPGGWPPVEPELFEATRDAYSKIVTADRFTSRPVRIYSDGEKRFFMIVSEFPSWPAPLDPYVAFADYANRLQGALSDVEIDQAFYRHGNLEIYHLIIKNPVMINHRLIVLRADHAPVQVDYLLPLAGYSTFVKAIEASIGSFVAL
jgi:hypothetical protein